MIELIAEPDADWQQHLTEVSLPGTPNSLHLILPYVAFWSFGEKMPVLDEGTKDPESIGFAMETLTALLAHRLAGTDLLARNRDQFVASARRSDATTTDFDYDVFISYSRGDAPFVEALRRGLEKRGLHVFQDPEIPPRQPIQEVLQRTIERSRSFAKPRTSSKWQDLELEMMLRQLYDRHRARRIVPLLRGAMDTRELPPPLQSFQYVRWEDKPNTPSPELLDRLAASLTPSQSQS